MLNEIHAAFCQDVCPRWPTLPSGTTTLDPLMLELRKIRTEDRMRHKNVERQISTIKAMLDESGDLMNDEERSDLRKQLYMLRKKSLSMAASDDGSG